MAQIAAGEQEQQQPAAQTEGEHAEQQPAADAGGGDDEQQPPAPRPANQEPAPPARLKLKIGVDIHSLAFMCTLTKFNEYLKTGGRCDHFEQRMLIARCIIYVFAFLSTAIQVGLALMIYICVRILLVTTVCM